MWIERCRVIAPMIREGAIIATIRACLTAPLQPEDQCWALKGREGKKTREKFLHEVELVKGLAFSIGFHEQA